MVSIGCSLSSISNIPYSLFFTDIQDSPEENILPLFQLSNEFIVSCIQQKLSVLIHCVYGQSRSVSLCVAYLVHEGMSLEEALNLMMQVHPTTCINPGFLSQLHLFANRRIFPAEYSLLTSQYNRHRGETAKFQYKSSGRRIKCRNCGYTLCLTSEVVTRRDSLSVTRQFQDSFWKGYSPQHPEPKPLSFLSNEYVFISPPRWTDEMIVQLVAANEYQAPLVCPKCTSEVGIWRRKGLLVCDDCVAVDLFGLSHRSIRLP